MDAGLHWIDENAGALTGLAREIWEYAELGLREVKSSAAQARYLAAQGFRVEHGVARMPTALVASFGEGKPIIGFLGEYDALPGLSQQTVPHKQPVVDGAPGHGCGHNLLGVGSLAAAVALKREIEAGRLKGTVRYYGCPAEETLSGKVFMAKHGLFDDLDAAITWHPMWLNTPNYCSFLANNSARFAFHGRTSHAAAAPHLGISALDAVELMNVGANYLREHVPADARIHYVITNGGSQPNIVPDFAEVWYYVRAPRRAEVESIYDRLIMIAEGACLMTGATFEVKFQKGVYEVLPNPVVTRVIEESLRRVGPPSFTEEEKTFARELEQSYTPGQKAAVLAASGVPAEYWDVSLHDTFAPGFDQGKVLPGSTDVGDVSWVAPTGCLTTATWVAGTAAHSWQATATSGMSIGFKGMLVAAKAMALAGFELASNPDLLCQARATFVKDTGDRPYVSPLPEGMDEPGS